MTPPSSAVGENKSTTANNDVDRCSMIITISILVAMIIGAAFCYYYLWGNYGMSELSLTIGPLAGTIVECAAFMAMGIASTYFAYLMTCPS